NRRRRIEVVAGALVSHPRAAVPSTPECEIRFRIVISGDPDRAAAGFPLITFRPGLTSRFARSRYCVSAPLFLAGFGIERRDKAANTELSSRCTDHHFASRNERRKRDVIAGS